MADPVKLRGEAADVARAETQAVLAMVQDEDRRGRLGDLIAAVDEGELEAGSDEAQSLEEVLELGLQSGRVRALYGPGGEQAALKVYRQLPRGKELGDSAKEVTEAFGALKGKPLTDVSIQAAGPGAFILSIGVEGYELSVRLDRSGARINSVGI